MLGGAHSCTFAGSPCQKEIYFNIVLFAFVFISFGGGILFWFEQQNFCLTSLEAGSARSMCEQGWEGGSAPCLSPDAIGLRAVFGIPWLLDTSPCLLPPPSHGVLPLVHVGVQTSTFYKDTICIRLRDPHY